MLAYLNLKDHLSKNQYVWLITGVAGFIGSNLLEELLKLNQRVIGLDNFSTGHSHNLNEIQSLISPHFWENFNLIDGDICNLEDCNRACIGVDHVLHQAALGSVPRSIEDPIATNHSNVSGFLNMLVASRDAKAKSFTYAASSSTYGDHPTLPKVEENIGKPLSPYAITKYVNELYAEIFASSYQFKSIGLRYFNVFGKRQDPIGAYAAVIPKWIDAMIQQDKIYINGNGETSRDFCYIENVIQANLLSAFSPSEARDNVYNVAVGERTSLNELFFLLKQSISNEGIEYNFNPIFRDFRAGDVLHSQASIDKICTNLDYCPLFKVREGILESMKWYVNHLKAR